MQNDLEQNNNNIKRHKGIRSVLFGRLKRKSNQTQTKKRKLKNSEVPI